jgi:ferredoxin
MMGDKNETPKGEDYRAVIDTEKCTVSGECFKVCEVDAIKEGPRRMSCLISCACAGGGGELPELLPGKSVVDYDVCNGCGDCIDVCPSKAIEMVHLDVLNEALRRTKAYYG